MTRYPPRKPSPRAVRDLHETYARTATPSAGRQAAAAAARDEALDEAAAFVDGWAGSSTRVSSAFRGVLSAIAAGIRARRSEGGR